MPASKSSILTKASLTIPRTARNGCPGGTKSSSFLRVNSFSVKVSGPRMGSNARVRHEAHPAGTGPGEGRYFSSLLGESCHFFNNFATLSEKSDLGIVRQVKALAIDVGDLPRPDRQSGGSAEAMG
jgi:hypothetical protein